MADALLVVVSQVGEPIVRDGKRENGQRFVTVHSPVRGCPIVTVDTSRGRETFTASRVDWPAMSDGCAAWDETGGAPRPAT